MAAKAAIHVPVNLHARRTFTERTSPEKDNPHKAKAAVARL
jgi:hypothetical protein